MSVLINLKKTADINSALIVDDHNLSRYGLKNALESVNKFDAVYEAENGQNALKLSKKFKPSLIIIDLCLPDTNSIDIIKRLINNDNKIKIVALSSENNDEMILDALHAGARAYCSKNTRTEKLITLIEMVLDGAIWFDSSISENILNIIKKEKTRKTCSEKTYIDCFNLTDRETDVLKLIANGHNNAEISAKLCVSIHTAKAHVCSILHKMRVEDRTQAAIMALKKKII